MGYTTEKVTFKGSQDLHMDARLEVPDSKIKAYAIFAHCFIGSKKVYAATQISRALTDMGIAVLIFDFTSMGNSDGDFSNTNFSTNVGALTAAYLHMSYHHEAPEILIGHSLGGAAVLAAANSMPRVKVVATIAAPIDVIHVEKLLIKEIKQIEHDEVAEVNLADRKFTIKKQFLDDIRSISIEQKISQLSASLLIFHSTEDKVFSIENAYQIYKAAPEPKSIVSLNGASHLLDKADDSEFVAKTIALWCTRYLKAQQEERKYDGEEAMLDESGKESFPASDSPGFISHSYNDRKNHSGV